ncbi:MAG: hypothetical protein WC613_01300 [Candidatus Aenigmatarchaeota archaeon]
MKRAKADGVSDVRNITHDYSLNGAVLASEALFPFRDSMDAIGATKQIRAVAETGGSTRDQESIDAANEHDIALVFTGERTFRH